jgi:hypothetical protein
MQEKCVFHFVEDRCIRVERDRSVSFRPGILSYPVIRGKRRSSVKYSPWRAIVRPQQDTDDISRIWFKGLSLVDFGFMYDGETKPGAGGKSFLFLTHKIARIVR